MINLDNKSILITGGTGSFGKAFVKFILIKFPKIKKIAVYSRDEQKHHKMFYEFAEKELLKISFIVGDVRDLSRLDQSFTNIDIVIHAAAMKYVHLAEKNPLECVKTNIDGAKNIIIAALNNKVEKVIAISTDKAVAPTNLYGATKLVSDKLFVSANNTDINTIFSVVRCGNIIGSSGSVIPFFLNQKKNNKEFLPITNKEMTRFSISLEEVCNLVVYALSNAFGGEIFTPKSKSFRICDLAEAIAPEINQKIVGLRPGERLHEEMISIEESLKTLDLGKYYVICKEFSDKEKYIRIFNAKPVKDNFSYKSNLNSNWETVISLRESIKKYIDPNFKV